MNRFTIASFPGSLLVCVTILMNGCSGVVSSLTVPEINDISPDAGFIGSLTVVTILGRNFQQGATVTVEPSSGVAVESVNFLGPTRMTASIRISQDATQDRRNITVANPDGERTTVARAFGAVGLGLVTIDSVTPNTGARGGIVQVTIMGTNFQDGASVITGPGIDVTNVIVNSVNNITATFNITDIATLGPQNLIVSDLNGFGNSCQGCFTVTQ